MPLGVELRPEFIADREPYRDEQGRLLYKRSREVTVESTISDWDKVNQAMDQQFDRRNCQIAVLTKHRDVTQPLYQSLQISPLTNYPVARTICDRFPDQQPHDKLKDYVTGAPSVYIVASILNPEDFSLVRGVAAQYKHIFGSQCVTLMALKLGQDRLDKNANKSGEFSDELLYLYSELAGLKGWVDRILAVEVHSGTAQAIANEMDMAFLNLSPGEEEIDAMIKKERIDPKELTFIGPDEGRNVCVRRLADKYGAPYISLVKTRISTTNVEYLRLSEADEDKLRGRTAASKDDVISTGSTASRIGGAIENFASKFYMASTHLVLTEGWQKNFSKHPNKIWYTDTCEPAGNPEFLNGRMEMWSVAPWVRRLLEADIEGVNFAADNRFRSSVIQPTQQEREMFSVATNARPNLARMSLPV